MAVVGAVIVVIVLFGLIALGMSVRVLREYERGVIFRLGRLIATKGPGPDPAHPAGRPDGQGRYAHRDAERPAAGGDHPRQRAHQGQRGRLLPRRSTPRGRCEVEDYLKATSQIAQTTLRRVLGQAELDELLADREKINQQLQKIIDEQTEPWGVKVSAVEIKDVQIPEQMQRAMARRPRRSGSGAPRSSGPRASSRRRRSSPRRPHHQHQPGRAAAALPADAAGNRQQPEHHGGIPAAAGHARAVPRSRPAQTAKTSASSSPSPTPGATPSRLPAPERTRDTDRPADRAADDPRARASRAAGGLRARRKRAEGTRRCPFCEGREERTPPEVYAVRPEGGPPDTPGWTTRVVPNLYPALGAPRGRRAGPQVRLPRPDRSPRTRRPAAGIPPLRRTRSLLLPCGPGAHEVIVNAPGT